MKIDYQQIYNMLVKEFPGHKFELVLYEKQFIEEIFIDDKPVSLKNISPMFTSDQQFEKWIKQIVRIYLKVKNNPSITKIISHYDLSSGCNHTLLQVHYNGKFYRIKKCPNPDCCSEGFYLDIHQGFDYIWCKTCGVRGPTFDGHILDAIFGWNNLSRKGEE